VVGGLSAIALIVLGIWALMRWKHKQKENAAATAATSAGTTQQQHPPSPTPHQDPHMSHLPAQGYYGAAAAGYNQHNSIAKPPSVSYSGYTGSDQPNVARSPPPQSPPPQSPPPPPGYFNVQGTPSPPQQQQQFRNVSPGTQVSAAGYQQQEHSPPLQQSQQQGFGGGQGHRVYMVELPAERGDRELREM
jgi:hypothetical protein